jgi:hypothetical protein
MAVGMHIAPSFIAAAIIAAAKEIQVRLRRHDHAAVTVADVPAVHVTQTSRHDGQQRNPQTHPDPLDNDIIQFVHTYLLVASINREYTASGNKTNRQYSQ